MRKSVLVGGALLLAAVVLLLSLGGFEQSGNTAVRENLQGKPRYVIANAEWTRLGADGKTVFHINAEHIDYYDDESARMTNLSLDGLDQGKGPWRLTSPLGEMPARDKRILLNKPVVMTGAVKQGEAIKLITDQVWVDGAKKELYTASPVVMTRGTQQATATGMNADWAGQRLQLLHDVKVTYVPNG